MHSKKCIHPTASFYRSKIMGERGVAEGVIFGKYLNDSFFSKAIEVVHEGRKQVMNEIDYNLQTNRYLRYSFGLDLGNNEIKNGTILTWSGITRGYKERHVIDVYECTATETNALVNEICYKLKEWTDKIMDLGLVDGLWIDGYGAIAIMIPTIRKRLKDLRINIKSDLAIKFGDDGGRMSRMLLYLMLINQKASQVQSNSWMQSIVQKTYARLYIRMMMVCHLMKTKSKTITMTVIVIR